MNLLSRTVADGDCLLWQGAVDRDGYGSVRVSGKTKIAHRVAFEMANGPIPTGKVVCHRCDRPSCINADHLFIGSHADNRADCVAKGRVARGERHGNAVLTEEKVRAIRSARASGESLAGLAKRFGVSKSTIFLVVKGETWVTP